MFKNVLNSVKNLLQNGDKKEAQQKLMEAFDKAISEGGISADELAEIQKLQKELGISDEEMTDIKIKVLDKLMAKITEDGTISEEEVRLLNQVKQGLGVDIKIDLKRDDSITKEDLQHGLESVKNFLGKMKDKTLEVGDKVLDKTKEIGGKVVDKTKEIGKEVVDKTKDLFDGDEKEKGTPPPQTPPTV